MFKQLLKNKKIKIILSVLAASGLILAVGFFIAQAAKPPAPSAATMNQYGSSTSTPLANGGYLKQNQINLYATSTDNTDHKAVIIYYQLATTSGTFISSTSTPSTVCSSGTAWASCPSRVWGATSAGGGGTGITWGTATNISGDTDVKTDGTLKYAYAWSNINQTLNGVAFVGTNVSNGNVGASSDLTVNTSGPNTSNVVYGDSALLSAAYQNVLSGLIGQYYVATAWTLTLNNLTSGHSYKVQLWANDSYYDPGTTNYAATNNVTVDDNITNSSGVGQYVTGTFTANGTTQAITVTPSGAGYYQGILNAMQLRDTTVAATEPKYMKINTVPDGNYKWQALACTSDGCSAWTAFNASTPNIRIDTTNPTVPGSLTLSKKNDSSVTLKFAATSTDTNFYQYKIFYKAGASGLKISDTLFGSSTSPGDTALGTSTLSHHSTTTVTGLSVNTQYVFNIWAYDKAGNKASGTTEFVQTTKNFPASASSLNQYKSDGATLIANSAFTNQNEVKLFSTSTDADSDAITLYYQLATTSGTYITVTTTPAGACSSGAAWAACPARVWQTPAATKKADITAIPDGNYKWQVLACDADGCAKSWTAFNGTTPNIKIDATAPAFTNTLTRIASTTASIKLGFPTAATEAFFYQYKIYYKIGSTTKIHETDSLWGSSSDANLGSQTFNGKSSTTITGLAAVTTYSFSLWAYDQIGNKASTTLMWDRTDRSPTLAINSRAERVDASGKVDISFTTNDPDKDIQLMARVEYFADALCHTSANQAALDETDAATTATYGDPKVQNKNTYQIGTSTGWIITSSGANTVNTVWLAKTDLPTADGTYCLRLTVSDNKGATAVSTSSLYIDNKAPTAPGPLTVNKYNNTTITINFNSATTETNFSRYKIFYKIGSSGARETDTEFSSSTSPGDAALGSKTYLSHSTTTISGLQFSTRYVYNIWAYDAYGNKASGTVELVNTTAPPVAEDLAQYKSDGSTNIINGGWLNAAEVNLYATSTNGQNGTPTIYYQLASTSGTLITATTTPASPCSTGTAYGSCPGKIWYSSRLVKADITGIPSNDYKWQALACNLNTCSKAWKVFNVTTPNFSLDTTPPTAPGSLTLNKKNNTGVTVNFNGATTETNFYQYKIFYKAGSSGVKITDTLFGSSTSPGDAALGSITYSGHATTAITGLNAGTQYVFNIWAYDKAGNKASGTTEFVQTTKNFPAVLATSSTNVQQYKADGSTLITKGGWTNQNEVNLYATSTDADADLITIYYQLATTSGTFLAATTTPANACSSGTAYTSCPSRIWYSTKAIKADIKSIPDSATGYKWQAIACDTDGCARAWTVFSASAPNFKVDTVVPTFTNTLTRIASSSTSIKLGFPAAATEINFYQYKIYYRTGSTTAIHETDSLWGSSSDANLGSLSFNGKSSTTVTGLATSTWYSFSLWAYDSAGNKASTSLIYDRTDRTPTITFNSAAQRIDGTGKVDLSFTANDADKDNQLMAKLEYVVGAGCDFSSPSKATVDETDANTSAMFGDPKVQNKNAYQIGTSTGWILTSSGANTVNTVWLSQTDLPTGDNTYCLRITVSDNRGATKSANTILYIDNQAPTGLGSLTVNKRDGTSVVLNLGAAAAETNFRQYKIYYKIGSSGAAETDTAFGSSTTPGDTVFSSRTYSGHTTTTVTGLSSGVTYVFNIWAYDTYGNKAHASAEATAYIKSYPTGLQQYGNSTSTPLSNGAWIKQNQINLYATSTTYKYLYYQLATTSGAFITSTSSAPSNACVTGTAYASCPSRVWGISAAALAMTWTGPTAISAGTDVDNSGTTLYAYDWANTSQTVNGVAFTGTNSLAGSGDGNITFTTSAEGIGTDGSTIASYNGIIANFANFTSAGNGNRPVVLHGLTVGHKYRVQVWSSTNNNSSYGTISFTDTNSLDMTAAAPVPGQYGYGDFVATAATETINLHSSAYHYLALNAVQVRDITPAGPKFMKLNSVPDGSYRWQVLGCGISGCNNWNPFNPVIPNISVDTTAPTAPGSLTLSKKNDTTITLAFHGATTETNFYQYKIYYKAGSSGVKETNTLFGSSSDANLGSKTYGGAATTTISGLFPNVQYVFNIYAYDLAGNKASGTTEIAITTKNYPAAPSSLNQYRSDGITALANGAPINQNEINLFATSTDADSDAITLYYQLASTSGTYLTATTAPANACSSGTTWASCPSRVWQTPAATKKVDIKTIADNSYKWQALACDADGCSRSWTAFNGATPNFTIDATAPTVPGNLSLSKKNDGSITLAFSSASADPHFSQYKIYYKAGTSGVKITDTVFSSSSDSALGSISYSGHATTTISGLFSGANYVFNIWAYDTYGNKASGTAEFTTATKNFPAAPSGLNQYKSDGTTALGNTAVISQTEVNLYATTTDAESDAITLYYQLASTSGTYLTATTAPANACSSGTAWASCPSRVWQTPASVKKVDITTLPDNDYKWQVLACDIDGCSRSWTAFNGTTPNFSIDTTNPTKPGSLTFSKKNTSSMTLAFGSAASDSHFYQYKIYYKAGSSGVKETDTLFSSSSDSALGSITYLGHTTTSITGLTSGTQYVFNIFVYDRAGNKASGTTEFVQTTSAATRYWYGRSSTGNANNMNDGNNYTPTGPLLASDNLIFNSGATSSAATANLTAGSITSTAGFSGNWSISGYSLISSSSVSFDEYAGSLNLGNSITINGNSAIFHIGASVGAL
ncbi:MAG: fibronectin type III domain-containing protein, partial [Patescibacteria group bacterium]|nr:fibronectin type III domain-containing protein [Patescibacteria group bacterium]